MTIQQIYLPVAGTWSRHRERVNAKLGLPGDLPWYRTGSDFDIEMRKYGLFRWDQNGDPAKPDTGYWSGDLEGTMFSGTWWNPFDEKHVVWRDGADDLARTIQALPATIDRIWVIAHSHGGQVACYALRMLTPAFARRVNLITVDTPNRSGWAVGRHMKAVYAQVSRTIGGRWVHLHTTHGWEDRMRWMGARTMPWMHATMPDADTNIEVPDHSCALDVEAHRAVWDQALQEMPEAA